MIIPGALLNPDSPDVLPWIPCCHVLPYAMLHPALSLYPVPTGHQDALDLRLYFRTSDDACYLQYRESNCT